MCVIRQTQSRLCTLAVVWYSRIFSSKSPQLVLTRPRTHSMTYSTYLANENQNIVGVHSDPRRACVRMKFGNLIMSSMLCHQSISTQPHTFSAPLIVSESVWRPFEFEHVAHIFFSYDAFVPTDNSIGTRFGKYDLTDGSVLNVI